LQRLYRSKPGAGAHDLRPQHLRDSTLCAHFVGAGRARLPLRLRFLLDPRLLRHYRAARRDPQDIVAEMPHVAAAAAGVFP